ncbi:hypothetical protein PPGU19_095090 (plasmid) [Paraburkholderia sp. PGU19]|uniref:hypothetical protein n=1 Tax=Paraburkholderia sp. PGU19 TaxID=2735434 RepID=UPI0015DAA6E8|nr:hypothetical protein [Paraburkholderia sp. PGU19]BCG04941.1 hypothetical protein PPGU19_095090 [Paraburkholderia sp. PGU19]
MDILKLAADAGLQVLLDGRIGRIEYRSVTGSLQALQRFADALLRSAIKETRTHVEVNTSRIEFPSRTFSTDFDSDI